MLPADVKTARDWPRPRKWIATLIPSGFLFLQALTETMLVPVEKQVSRDLHIRRPYEWILCNSLVLVGIGFGPLLLAPLSEVYGRKPILLSGSAVFLIWNTGCGAAPNLESFLVFRLLSGFGACVADAIAGGLLSDLWRAEERGKAFAVYMAAPLLGPALGPIFGAFISEGANWKWVFWTTSIATGVGMVVAMPFFKETYEPKIRQTFAKKSQRQQQPMSTEKTTAFLTLMRANLQRPFRMLATQPIVQLLATYMGLLYGTMFLFLYMYPRMWEEHYHQSIRIGSLNYISAAIGYVVGVNVAGHLNDWIYAKLKARNGGVGKPEFRVPAMIVGTLLVPIGLIWWGWSGQARIHWIMPNIGCFIFTTGCYVCASCVSLFLIDTYVKYSASALSTALLTRSCAAAFFPLFAPYMFDRLGFGIAATVLAAAFSVFGMASIAILWFYGERIRSKSTYCTEFI